MTTYGTFNDVPLARGADIELAAADHARQYRDVIYCRRHSLCWWCLKSLSDWTPPDERLWRAQLEPPACPECTRKRNVEVRE